MTEEYFAGVSINYLMRAEEALDTKRGKIMMSPDRLEVIVGIDGGLERTFRPLEGESYRSMADRMWKAINEESK